nr:hypothetical transcript [Hymenolepis microstoma]
MRYCSVFYCCSFEGLFHTILPLLSLASFLLQALYLIVIAVSNEHVAKTNLYYSMLGIFCAIALITGLLGFFGFSKEHEKALSADSQSAIQSTGRREQPETVEIHKRKTLYQLLKEKYKTIVLQWILGHCDSERADILAKKGTTIVQVIDQPISFYTMKTLIRRDFKTLRSNELKARTGEKQWTVTLSNIADWPRLEAVVEFRPRTGHDSLAKHLHRMGVYAQTT